MKALRFEKTGSLDELKIEEVPQPEPAPGNVLVEVKAAALKAGNVGRAGAQPYRFTLANSPAIVPRFLPISGEAISQEQRVRLPG